MHWSDAENALRASNLQRETIRAGKTLVARFSECSFLQGTETALCRAHDRRFFPDRMRAVLSLVYIQRHLADACDPDGDPVSGF
jgi:hypothetical protein